MRSLAVLCVLLSAACSGDTTLQRLRKQAHADAKTAQLPVVASASSTPAPHAVKVIVTPTHISVDYTDIFAMASSLGVSDAQLRAHLKRYGDSVESAYQPHVTPLASGRYMVDDDVRQVIYDDLLVEPLQMSLNRLSELSVVLAGRKPGETQVPLRFIVDTQVPYVTVRRVLATASGHGWTQFELLVHVAHEGAMIERVLRPLKRSSSCFPEAPAVGDPGCWMSHVHLRGAQRRWQARCDEVDGEAVKAGHPVYWNPWAEGLSCPKLPEAQRALPPWKSEVTHCPVLAVSAALETPWGEVVQAVAEAEQAGWPVMLHYGPETHQLRHWGGVPLTSVRHLDETPSEGWPILTVTPEGIGWADEQVVALDHGRIPAAALPKGPDGWLIDPLHDRLTADVQRLKEQAALRQTDFEGALQVAVHGDVPHSTLMRVLYTAGQAEFGDFEFPVGTQRGVGALRYEAPKYRAVPQGEERDEGSTCLAPVGRVMARETRWSAHTRALVPKGATIKVERAVDDGVAPSKLLALLGESGGPSVMTALSAPAASGEQSKPALAAPPTPTKDNWQVSDLCRSVPHVQAYGAWHPRVSDHREALDALKMLGEWCPTSGTLSGADDVMWSQFALVWAAAQASEYHMTLTAGVGEQACDPLFWPGE
ncbi:MAG: hypothetical protein ACE366_01925 [Bradymonadia bacterium]